MNMLKNSINTIIDSYLIPFVFELHLEPLRLRQLLDINRVYSLKMNVEYHVPFFKLRLVRTYFIFIMLWMVFLLIVALILHKELAKIDCHALIISSMLITGLLFASFSIFKDKLYERVTIKLILNSWNNHFAAFNFKRHHEQIAHIYDEALDDEVAASDLERYIMKRIIES